MKKFSFKSFWSVATLVLTVFVLGSVATKTFAAYAGDYSEFAPSGCSSMSVFHIHSGDIAPGASLLVANTIYVIDDVPASIAGNISIDADCVSIVANGNAIGNTVLNFSGDKYISSNGRTNIRIAGFDATHRLEILGATSTAGIILRNTTGANISYTSLSGFTVFGGLMFISTTNSTISNNIITNNKHGIDLQGSSNNTITNNTVTNSTSKGIFLETNSNNNTISSNIVTGNYDGIFLTSITGCTISNNTVSTNTFNGIFLGGTTNSCTISNNPISNNYNGIAFSANTNLNTISSNTINGNYNGVSVDGGKSNTFTSNTILSNTNFGLQLTTAASGNIFTSDILSGNTNRNIYFSDAHNNQFINTTVRNSLVGIRITNSTFNTFSGVNVFTNTTGMQINASSNNTLKLTNNTNGIYLTSNSDNNNILNTQILGENNITISNGGGSNNSITGGLFSALTTTVSPVNILLKNNQGAPQYDITGAGLSGTYPTTLMTGSTGTVAINLSAGDGVKNIIVNYNNGNKQYDNITLSTYIPPSGGGGNPGGGGGGGSSLCTIANLICVNGVRTHTTGSTCQGGNLGLACTVHTGGNGTGILPVGSIVGSIYSTELNNAYLWAYAHGITTMNTIQKADMGGKLIRAHMAKMISNFAITLGGFTPDTSKSCVFDDIGNQSAEMRFYIKLSCQLGLMGIGIDSFNPTGQITRAEFGTILSRLIWGSTYEGGVKYYTNHLNALKAAGIMTQISNPSVKELRGYVMIMMKRTYEGGFLNN